MALQKQTENHVLGAGEVYVDLDDGNGFRYLGDTPSFQFTMTSETLDFWKSDTAVAVKSDEAVIRVDRSGTLQLRDISPDNMALFLVGSKSVHSQTAASGETENITVNTGGIYNIGETAANPAGARNLSNVSVTDQSGTPSYTEGTDYEVDTDNGMIQILASGSISDGDTITVTYDAAGVDWDLVKSGSEAKKTAKVMFISKNRKGDQANYIMPEVELAPDGEFNLQSTEDWATMGFAMTILEPDNQEAIYMNGAPYAP